MSLPEVNVIGKYCFGVGLYSGLVFGFFFAVVLPCLTGNSWYAAVPYQGRVWVQSENKIPFCWFFKFAPNILRYCSETKKMAKLPSDLLRLLISGLRNAPMLSIWKINKVIFLSSFSCNFLKIWLVFTLS